MHNRLPLAIVGAGASGLMAAYAAARVRPHSVVLLEKQERAGRKLLATGNGRCNLLNARPDPGRYHGSGAALARAYLERTPPAALEAVFARMGLVCREEEEGRVYPHSGQASAVLDVLRFACARSGVDLRCGQRVLGIERRADSFALHMQETTLRAGAVVIAAGGAAAPSLGADESAYSLLSSLGHRMAPLRPALSPLKLDTSRIRGLKGVRTPCALTLEVDGRAVQCERGEALFTDYGVSGVAAMQLARRAEEAVRTGRKTALRINLLEGYDALALAEARAALLDGMALEDFFAGLLHRRIGLCLLREAGIAPQTPVSPGAARRVAALLQAWTLPVAGVLPLAHAQITAGGAHASEFDPDTLMSRRAAGLFACGEALDVDGDCGGYNLMWAWLSGLTAGESAARYLEGRDGR